MRLKFRAISCASPVSSAQEHRAEFDIPFNFSRHVELAATLSGQHSWREGAGRTGPELTPSLVSWEVLTGAPVFQIVS